jgi:Fe-S-cluster-containing hydrogenase component 2/putative sterol carrier protein
MKIDNHPTVLQHRAAARMPRESQPLDADWLRTLARECGADDAGLVAIDRPELEDQREEIVGRYPWTKTLLAFVRRMSREPVRSTARSIANLEFHHKGEAVNEIALRIVERLEAEGIRAVCPSMGFPMEMSRFPERVWVVGHKPVAVAAGLGHMGIHRNVIHPRFGNFVLLGTVLLDRESTSQDRPLDYNPCLECNLCVAACPVGAISPRGEFNFTACFTHNYREFMGGFNDWVEQVVDSRSVLDYRRRINDAETASLWQSLSFGPNYKSAYCMAVCPAGEDVIGPFLADRKRHLNEVVKPLQDKPETVYVVAGSDAEAHARKRFKNKWIKHVGSGVRPNRVRGFLESLPLGFQPQSSEGLNATYHFTFTGDEETRATIVIADKSIRVQDGHQGDADLQVTVDGKTWLGILAREKSLAWAIVTRRLRLKGSPALLVRFGKCFPSAAIRRGVGEDRREHPVASPRPTAILRNDEETGHLARDAAP